MKSGTGTNIVLMDTTLLTLVIWSTFMSSRDGYRDMAMAEEASRRARHETDGGGGGGVCKRERVNN